MSQSTQEILNSTPAFISSILSEAKECGIDLSHYEMDHFCIRVETIEQYKHYKKEFEAFGILLSEAKVNGRPISTYKLNVPIKVQNKVIPCVEIPSPKEGSPYPLGLEHVECVVEEALGRFIQRFPQLSFDCRAMKQSINPEVALKLPSGKCVKFHNQTLESVIEIEKKLGF